MRRFLLPVLILTLALILPACAAKKADPKWGNLEVTLENVQQTETQWSANLVIKNPTDKMQVLQYNHPAKYTMVIKRKGQTEELMRRGFDQVPQDKPEILNIAGGVTKAHPVVWTYLDEAGKKVEPGNYDITVELNAVTVDRVPEAGQPAPKAFERKVLGPVTVAVK